MTVAKYCPELKMADAVPRSLPGNQAATIRAFAGNDGASAQPTRKRSANSTTTALAPLKKPIKPCITVNSDQIVMLKAQGIDPARAKAVEQPSARHLRDHIGPAEGENT